MRVQVLRIEDRVQNGAVFDAMHRQRHAVFVEQLGWSALRSDTGREADAFDDQHAVYFVACDDGDVCGSVRLLPAWRRSMLVECWPTCIAANAPDFDQRTWEWTRWCPGVTARPRQLIAARRALILAAVDFAQSQGGERFVTFCDLKFVDQLLEIGWAPRVLGPTWAYPQGEAVGIGWEIGSDAFLRLQAQLTLPRPSRRAPPRNLALAA